MNSKDLALAIALGTLVVNILPAEEIFVLSSHFNCYHQQCRGSILPKLADSH